MIIIDDIINGVGNQGMIIQFAEINRNKYL